jgi:hypothetical protein
MLFKKYCKTGFAKEIPLMRGISVCGDGGN